MCKAHSPSDSNISTGPQTKEFSGIGADEWIPIHCGDCAHVVKGRMLTVVMAGAALLALGLVLATVSRAAGLVLIVAGAVLGGAGYAVDRQRVAEAARSRPALPLVPNVESIRVRETLNGRLTLDVDGGYHTSVEPVEGDIRLAMTFGRPDWDRLERYRRKYRLAPDAPVDFSAGLAVLRGPVGLKIDDCDAGDGCIALTGCVGDHAFFRPGDGRPSPQWAVDLRHRLDITPDIDFTPIWITPTLAPESDQRTLELELQWIDFGSDEAKLLIDRIEPFRLLVPPEWGDVDSAVKGASIGLEQDAAGNVSRVIEWARISFDDEELRNRRFAISVRFEKKIGLTDVIRGNLSVVFKGALSGVQGVDLYHPLGWRRSERFKQTVRTQVNADFELSLSGVRYQDVRVVPDRKHPADDQRSELTELPGVIPDYETVAWLTNAMSDDGYYVKRVIENPPRSSGRAHVVNRYWDIAGRRYDGVYPVDFHVVLTGEEVHDGDIRAHAGNTKARITVRGAYANPAMAEKVEKEWERLHGLTVDTLQQRAGAAAAEPAGEPRARTAESAERLAVLRRRQDELTEALLDGRISEETYQRINSRIEQEIEEFYGFGRA